MYARTFATVVAAVVLPGLCGSMAAAKTDLVYVYGGTFNLPIPEEPGETEGWMQNAVIDVPRHMVIKDIDVLVDISHTSAFDLQLTLQGPTGKTILLSTADSIDGFFRGEDYRWTRFDDDALISIEAGGPPFEGSYQPLGSLAVFNGLDAFGPWTLRVYDRFEADTGRLNAFVLIITTPEPATAAFLLLGLALIRPRSVRRGLR
jgi:subtilisin-like proprotein convertase family protein